MMRRWATVAIPLAVLAACSDGGEQDAAPPAPEPVAEAGSDPGADMLEAMPAEFRGRWDFALEDCADDASEMRLVIEPTEVRYYESSAELTAIARTGERSLAAEHRFAGEGEEWTETLGYELNEAGDRLSVTTPEGSLSIRMRCP